MTTETTARRSPDVTDGDVRGMVDAIKPDWRTESVDRSEYGTDFVAVLDVTTPAGGRKAVLKATTADFVPSEVAQSEPRLLDFVGANTTIPVPAVFGFRDDHEHYPAPFYLMEYVDGENYEDGYERLSRDVREAIIDAAGRNLAELHGLGPLPAYGRLGVQDGELTVLDTAEHPHSRDFHERLLSNCEETLDSLTDGGFFPDLADDPDRFADLVPRVREYVREAIPALPEPDAPTYCHWDYRYGNLLVDPETGETQAVLDWASLTAADPAYNLAKVELHLLSPETDGEELTDAYRETFRAAYAEARSDWSFDESTRERMRVYELAGRLDAMACLPLWYQDSTPAQRDERAGEHRAFVEQYL